MKIEYPVYPDKYGTMNRVRLKSVDSFVPRGLIYQGFNRSLRNGEIEMGSLALLNNEWLRT
jgi:hypothetical protein